MRDDFPEEVKRALAGRVANRCSNPECRAVTSGPQVDAAKALNVGVAAHITAASSAGPRHDPSLTPEQRRQAYNGIWLCQTCAKLVDNDPLRYSVGLLQEWKAKAEEAALSEIGKTALAIGGSPPARAPRGLRIELPPPVNPLGNRSSAAGYVLGWRFKVRLIAEGQALDILELGVSEDEVGDWSIEEVFRQEDGRPTGFPIPVERATEFWIAAYSPRTFATKPTSVGRLTLRFRDHTQPAGEAHEHVVDEPPIR